MEAPASLKGQLLACPKCGSHQIVKNVRWRRIFFVIISFLMLLGIYKFGLEVGYKNGIAAETRHWLFTEAPNYYKEGKKDGYQEGYDGAMAALKAFYDGMKEMQKVLPISIAGKFSEKFPCKNVSFDASDDYSLRIIGEITNDSNRTYDGVSFRISLYNAEDVLLDTGSFLILNFKRKQIRSFDASLYHSMPYSSIHHYKIDPDIEQREYNF